MADRFSVVLPVYRGDQAAFFRRALDSIAIEQELRPDEIVIVRDGPVGPKLEAVLADVRSGAAVDGIATQLVELPQNRGLARALEVGLKAASHDTVARADADDISLPQRFAKQLPTFFDQGLDLLGAAIVEFVDEDCPQMARVLPTEAAEIAAMSRFRDPFNHPTVVYSRRAVAAAGGYQHLNKMEDYWLFVRMIHHGCQVANLAEPLVLYRIGAGAYQRRGGWDMLSSELGLQRRMLASGFTSLPIAARNVVVRGLYRLVPAAIRAPLYRRMVTSGSAKSQP